MKCFYHQEKEAVGTCKSCCKGLCQDCAVDLTKGLDCRGHCEHYVRAVIALVERNIKFSAGGTKLYIFNLLIGAVLMGYELFVYRVLGVGVVLGAGFILWGLASLIQHRRRAKDL